MAKLVDDQFSGIGVDGLVLSGHDAILHQRLDDVRNAFCHAVGQLADHDRLGQLNVADDLLAFLSSAHRLLAGTLLLALHRGHGPLTSTFTAGQCVVQCQFATTAAICLAVCLGLGHSLFAAQIALAIRLAGY